MLQTLWNTLQICSNKQMWLEQMLNTLPMSCDKSLPLRMCESHSELRSKNPLLFFLDLLLVFQIHLLLGLLVNVHRILCWVWPEDKKNNMCLANSSTVLPRYLAKSVVGRAWVEQRNARRSVVEEKTILLFVCCSDVRWFVGFFVRRLLLKSEPLQLVTKTTLPEK